jgi:hypothetical protein
MERNFEMSPYWKLKKTAAALGLAAACLLSTGIANAESEGLVGTWVVQVQLHNCETGATVGGPFISLLTFDRGGTMTETTSNANFYPAVRGPAHGVWKETGVAGANHTYTSSQLALVTSDGVLTEGQTVRQTIVIGSDPNAFDTPSASVEFYSPDLKLLKSGCATAKGVRFE